MIPKRQPEILYSIQTTGPKPMQYRAIRDINGGFRMEKKGVAAKYFRAYAWTGSEDCVVSDYFVITSHHGLSGEVPAYVQKWVDAGGLLPWWVKDRIEEFRKKGYCR